MHSCSIVVDIFLSLMRSYLSFLVFAFKLCHGSDPAKPGAYGPSPTSRFDKRRRRRGSGPRSTGHYGVEKDAKTNAGAEEIQGSGLRLALRTQSPRAAPCPSPEGRRDSGPVSKLSWRALFRRTSPRCSNKDQTVMLLSVVEDEDLHDNFLQKR